MVKKANKRGTFKKRRRNRMRYSHRIQRGGAGFMFWKTSTDKMLKELDNADIKQLIEYINTTHAKIENTENGWKTKEWSQADLQKYDDALNKLISKLTNKYLAILNSTISIDPSVIIELNTNMKTIYENYRASLLKQDDKLATQNTENLKKELETITQSIKKMDNKIDENKQKLKKIDVLIPIYEKRKLGIDVNQLTVDQTIINEVNKITDNNAKIQQLNAEKTQLEAENMELEAEKKIIETTKLGGAGNQDTINFINNIITEIDNFDINNKQSLANAVENLDTEFKTLSNAVENLDTEFKTLSNADPYALASAPPQPIPGKVIGIVSGPQDVKADAVPVTAVDVNAEPYEEVPIDEAKLKELINKSYVQSILYLKLAKEIIKANLVKNPEDKNLINLQTKMDKAIADLTVSEEEASALNIDTSAVSNDKVNGIVEIMLSLIGMGIISATALGGRKTKKYRKGRKYNKRKRQTFKR
jgi:hypothetical protein